MVSNTDDVSIDPETENPIMRTTPEHKIKEVRAKGPMVVIVGIAGDTEVENIVNRKEAIERAQAISAMVKHAKYASDVRELQSLVEEFIMAITKAKENEGSCYRSNAVSMYVGNKKE